MAAEEIVTAEVADPTRFGSPTALAVKVGNQVFVSGMLAWDTERRMVGVGDVKFRGHITPEVERVRYEVDMRQVRRGRLVLGIADGRVFADDACVYIAKDMRVSLIASVT